MAYYLTLLEGLAPNESHPILATSDEELIQLFVRALNRKLSGTAVPVLLKPARHRKADTSRDEPDQNE